MRILELMVHTHCRGLGLGPGTLGFIFTTQGRDRDRETLFSRRLFSSLFKCISTD